MVKSCLTTIMDIFKNNNDNDDDDDDDDDDDNNYNYTVTADIAAPWPSY
jgi:hypothetical protein